MKRALTILALVALAGCQPKTPEAPPAPAAAEPREVSDFSRPMTARGTEPFWALTLDGTRLVLTRPDRPDIVAEAPGAAISTGRAIWIAKAADGQQLTVTFYVSNCSDGMSDHVYPMTAEVVLLNERLHGCAAKTAELPKPAA